MVLTGDDLELRLSGDTNNADPTLSIGGAISDTAVSGTLLHNIFDKIIGDESADGDTEYRILYVRNSQTGSPNNTAENVRVYVDPNYLDFINIGISQAKGVVAPALTDEESVPASVSFDLLDARDNSLGLGDLDRDEWRAIYLRRIITPGASAQDNASFTVNIDADSGQ